MLEAKKHTDLTGHQIIELALLKVSKKNWNDAPAGYMPEEALAYLQGCADAYLHALEMIPTTIEIWLPIEDAPVGREMFVVKAIDVTGFSSGKYTSDPYCVWQEKKGEFVRWPHPFAPTHFMKLPK